MPNGAGGNQAHSTDGFRNWLAILVSLSSILVVFLLGVGVIAWSQPDKREQSIQLVLTAILPLIGAWVGTILAYFFSSENLRTAATITQQLTQGERLRSTPVRDKMIRRAEMKAVETKPFDQITVSSALQTLESAKVNRFIVLDPSDLPKLVIHRSFLDRYLASKSLASPPPASLTALTLKDMLDDTALKPLLASTFVTTREDSTLADAKARMDDAANCQDVFVTRNGTRSEPIVGWITNVIIEENARI